LIFNASSDDVNDNDSTIGNARDQSKRVNLPFGGKIMQERFVAFVALDWADQKHAGCLQEAGSDKVEHFVLMQKEEAIQEWVGQLRERFRGKKIALGVEQRKGALIYSLMKYELFVFFPLNTTASNNYRKALSASGAKSDRSDAELQLQFMRHHMDRLKRWKPDTVTTRQLSMLTENRRKLVDEASAVSNQIEALLKEYYPTAQQMVSKIKTSLACDFLKRWPTIESLKRAQPKQLTDFYHKRNCRNKRLIQQRLSIASAALPLIVEKPIISAYKMTLLARVGQLKTLLAAIAKFDQEIESIFKQHPDRIIYESFPSAGPALAPRLAVAFGEDRNKFDSASAILNLSGIAPVTRSSGKQKVVSFRFSAPKFQRQTFVEFARVSVQSSSWARAFYQRGRLQKKSHQAAIRALAFKWIRILFRCWKNHEVYVEATYLNALRRSNSPLIPLIGIT
jgi:transposase